MLEVKVQSRVESISKMKRALRIIGIIVGVLVVLIGVGYVTLVPKALKPPNEVSDLAELENYRMI